MVFASMLKQIRFLPPAVSRFRRLIRASKYLPGRFSSSRNPLSRDSLSEMRLPLLAVRALRLRLPLLAFLASWPASPVLRRQRRHGALRLSLVRHACLHPLAPSATSRRYHLERLRRWSPVPYPDWGRQALSD